MDQHKDDTNSPFKRGFTGTRNLNSMRKDALHARLDDLVEQGLSHAVTGACLGVDAEIVWYLLRTAAHVKHTIVVPANRKSIDVKLLDLEAEFVFMPDGTNFRDRNTKIVELSPIVDAFWTGQTARSGTYMTINIAREAKKLGHITKF